MLRVAGSFLVGFLGLLGGGCDSPSGQGTLVFTNRHHTCTLWVSLNQGEDHKVIPGRTVTVPNIPAGGVEMALSATPDTCILYSRQADSPLDNGRPTCNSYLDPNTRMSVVAVSADKPGGVEQINVLCPR